MYGLHHACIWSKILSKFIIPNSPSFLQWQFAKHCVWPPLTNSNSSDPAETRFLHITVYSLERCSSLCGPKTLHLNSKMRISHYRSESKAKDILQDLNAEIPTDFLPQLCLHDLCLRSLNVLLPLGQIRCQLQNEYNSTDTFWSTVHQYSWPAMGGCSVREEWSRYPSSQPCFPQQHDVTSNHNIITYNMQNEVPKRYSDVDSKSIPNTHQLRGLLKHSCQQKVPTNHLYYMN